MKTMKFSVKAEISRTEISSDKAAVIIYSTFDQHPITVRVDGIIEKVKVEARNGIFIVEISYG